MNEITVSFSRGTNIGITIAKAIRVALLLEENITLSFNDNLIRIKQNSVISVVLNEYIDTYGSVLTQK